MEHDNATNAGTIGSVFQDGGVEQTEQRGVSQAHQRWAREKYNAYQRMYMAAKRAIRKGLAEPLRKAHA